MIKRKITQIMAIIRKIMEKTQINLQTQKIVM
jgi:hypothetical protein